MSLIYVKRMRFKSAIVFPSHFVCSRSTVCPSFVSVNIQEFKFRVGLGSQVF